MGMSSKEISDQIRVILSVRDQANIYLSGQYFGQLLSNPNSITNELQSLTLDEISALPDDNVSKQLPSKIIKDLGGRTLLSQWITDSLLGIPVGPIWTEYSEKLPQIPSVLSNHPKWMQEIERDWNKEKNIGEELKQNPLPPEEFAETFHWTGRFIIFLQIFVFYINDKLHELEGELDRAQREEEAAKKGETVPEPEQKQSHTVGSHFQSLQSSKPHEEQTADQREQKRNDMRRNANIFLRSSFLQYCIDHGIDPKALRYFDALDENVLKRAAFYQALIKTNDSDFFTKLALNQPRLHTKLEQSNQIYELARSYVQELTQSKRDSLSLQEPVDVGNDTAQALHITDQLNTISKRMQIYYRTREDFAEKVFATSGSELRAEIQEAQDAGQKVDRDVLLAEEMRKSILRQMFTDAQDNQDQLNQLYADTGYAPAEGEEPSFDEWYQQSDASNSSIADLFKSQNNLQNFTKAVDQGSTIAKNPLLAGAIGGAAGVGGAFIYGAITQGLAGGAGAATVGVGGAIAGGWAGAQVGAAIGSIVPGAGTLIGGVFGAGAGALLGGFGAGYASTQITVGGGSLAQGIGNAELNLATAGKWGASQLPTVAGAAAQGAAAGAATAAPTAGALASQAAGYTATAGASSVATASNFLASLSHLTPAFSSALGAAGVVVGPIAAVGIITATVVVPTMLSQYLVPTVGGPGSASGSCSPGAWPTDGKISSTQYYPDGSFHSVYEGKAPEYSALPMNGHTFIVPTNSTEANTALQNGWWAAVDITNKQGTNVFAPYSGTAVAEEDQQTDPEGTTKATCRYFFKPAPDDDHGICYKTPYGNSIWIYVSDPQRGDFVQVYGHLSAFATGIPINQPFQVSANQFLGQMGATGNATGPHLHYEAIRVNNPNDTTHTTPINIAKDTIIPNSVQIKDTVSHSGCQLDMSHPPSENNSDCQASAANFAKYNNPPLTQPQSYKVSGCNRLVTAAKKYIAQLVPGFCDDYDQPTDPSIRSQFWNQSLYEKGDASNPRPQQNGNACIAPLGKGQYNFDSCNNDVKYEDMAWCTNLVNTIYSANVAGWKINDGGVEKMQEDWEQNTTRKTVLASDPTASPDQLVLGSAVFFNSSSNPWSHVAIVCDTNATAKTMTICEANNTTTTRTFTYTQKADGTMGYLDSTGKDSEIYSFGPPPLGLDDASCSSGTKLPDESSCSDNTQCQSEFCDMSKGDPSNPNSGICREPGANSGVPF
ncbi:hypothetical protein C5B42_01780 [Candidatus Cerribacteria bacterium 'Amazon FNV 2010 28 9']|uniref:M23ase beta-sheet core domain-containing protein n=1 Tax=Candidatus Cerribacteria bacterium 'Amazon FNV 2010 28 9' TaxID=2081795 RepID=A0A317JPF2_9BACT|nr:MAG: hypothetical protein C5B42_01780 [Candidatus Cerribacteria bacterium 'Amazon FNV 2010 28 9']